MTNERSATTGAPRWLNEAARVAARRCRLILATAGLLAACGALGLCWCKVENTPAARLYTTTAGAVSTQRAQR